MKNLSAKSKPDEKYENIIKLTQNMIRVAFRNRPTCGELLNTKENWYFGIGQIKDQLMEEIDNEITYDIDRDFVKFFLKAKFSLFSI